MNEFTVTITVEAVTSDEGWDTLYGVLDSVPGTVLMEDPDAPRLMFRVPAEHPFTAARFVEGVTTLLGITVLSGEIEMADDDFDLAEASNQIPTETSEISARAQRYVEDSDKILVA